MERYDAGLLNDYGGGDVEWWQDYIRAELERAHDFYTDYYMGILLSPSKEDLKNLVRNLDTPELCTLRAIINGKLSKRVITPEQQAKMQAGRRKPPT